jgi:hypothetical protein
MVRYGKDLLIKRDDRFCRISVDTALTLTAIRIDRIRQIPNNYQIANICKVSSYVAKIGDLDSICFMLDI